MSGRRRQGRPLPHAAALRSLSELMQRIRRSGGIVAKPGYLCCCSCASEALAGAHPDGTQYAYYTKQDRDVAAENGTVRLKFGVVGDAATDEQRAHVGTMLVERLSKRFAVRWDGNPVNTIVVDLAAWSRLGGN